MVRCLCLNTIAVINWFKRRLKNAKGTGSSRISDATLQKTMKIWHDTDADGSGVNKQKLQKVLTDMIRTGLMKVDASGRVVQ